jgi:hypothetical protein
VTKEKGGYLMGVLTRGTTTRFGLLAVLATAIVLVTSTLALGQTSGGESGLDLRIVDTMTLDLADGVQEVVFDPSTRSPQTISVKRNCELNPVAGPLLSISPQGGKLGTFGGDIGEKGTGKGGNGQPCGQVNTADEALTVALGDDGSLDGLSMARVDLGVEAKFNVEIRVVFLSASGAQIGTPYDYVPSGDSDSGPDSDDSYVQTIEPGFAFQGIRVEVHPDTPDAAYSLETTVFYLTDEITGILDCGDSVAIDNVMIARTTTDETNCATLIPYLLRIETGEVFLDKDLSQVNAAMETYTTEITWDDEQAEFPIAITKIDLGDGTGPNEVAWCGGGSSDPIWCLYSQDIRSNDNGSLTIRETYRGSGDPRWLR